VMLLVLPMALACGPSDGPPTSPAPPPAPDPLILSLVGGGHQEGTIGIELESPLTVRVMNSKGGVAGVQVMWRVESGTGVIHPSTLSVTDQSGATQVRFTPSTHRATVSAAIAAAEFAPARFHIVPAPVAVYSRESPSVGCAAAAVCERYFFYPDNTFALRYTRGFEYVGTFERQDSVISLSFRDFSLATGKLRNDSLIVTYDFFMSLSDFEDGGFRLEHGTMPPSDCWAARAVITLWRTEHSVDDAFYFEGDFAPATVRLGTLVEWHNFNLAPGGTARIRSTLEPKNGEPFDSGVLQQGQVFRFAPNVEGTWRYMDEVSGLTGTLNVSGLTPTGVCS
jgi:hypothetical protein